MINTSYNAWIVPIDEEIAHAHFHLPWMFVSDVCLINCIRLITTMAPNRNTITAIMEPNITINHVWVSISSARLWFIGCLQMRITTKKENEIKLFGSHSVAVLFVSAAVSVCWNYLVYSWSNWLVCGSNRSAIGLLKTPVPTRVAAATLTK